MAAQRAATGRRRLRRPVIALIMLVVITSLLSIVAVQAWSITGDDLEVVSAERKGTAYLRPIGKLVGELAEAQSTAVRGGAGRNNAVTAAVGAVDSVDQRYGDALEVHKLWVDARNSVTSVVSAGPTGSAAYDQYSEAIAVVLQLSRRVVDSAKLTLDPAIESYYLMDAAAVRLPEVIVGAGRAADLAIFAPPEAPEHNRVLIARYNVAADTEAISTGLAKALDASDSSTLGTNITGQLDAFRSAVDAFVPSGTRLRGLESMDTTTLTRNGEAVRQNAQPLAEAIFGELDALLESREDSLQLRRVLALGGSLLSLLLTLVVIALLIPRARAARHPEIPVGGLGTAPTQRGRPDTRAIDPHDLLSEEEILHVGAPARTIRRERDGNAG